MYCCISRRARSYHLGPLVPVDRIGHCGRVPAWETESFKYDSCTKSGLTDRVTSPVKPQAVGSGEQVIWSVRLWIGHISYPLYRRPEPTRTFAGRSLLPSPSTPEPPSSRRERGAGVAFPVPMAAQAASATLRTSGGAGHGPPQSRREARAQELRPPPTTTPARCPQAAL